MTESLKAMLKSFLRDLFSFYACVCVSMLEGAQSPEGGDVPYSWSQIGSCMLLDVGLGIKFRILVEQQTPLTTKPSPDHGHH